jgi:hypothetical protein
MGFSQGTAIFMQDEKTTSVGFEAVTVVTIRSMDLWPYRSEKTSSFGGSYRHHFRVKKKSSKKAAQPSGKLNCCYSAKLAACFCSFLT